MGNRFPGVPMSAIVFALVVGTLVYFGYGSVSMTTTPSTTAPVQTQSKFGRAGIVRSAQASFADDPFAPSAFRARLLP